jgi:hypothetical protein
MSNYSKIVLKNSGIADALPQTDFLDYGEIALNYRDKKIYFKNADNNITLFETPDISINGVSNTIVRRDSTGKGLFVGLSTTVNSAQPSILAINSGTGSGVLIESAQGTYHAEFGNIASDNAAAIDRVRGSYTFFYDGYKGKIKSSDITADRNWTLPNASGTVALTSDISDLNALSPITVGFENTASGTNASAVGYDNTASGSQSSAVGWRNEAGGILQVETATIVGSCTAAGNLSVTVVSALTAYLPLIISVPLTTAQNTASLVAAAVRTALNGTPAITYYYTVGGTGADYTLTAKVAAANDTTLNMSHAIVAPLTGITNAPTSVNTVVGTAGNNASAFGRSNQATVDYSSAFGYGNIATGIGSSAFGNSVQTVIAGTQEFGIHSAGVRLSSVRVHDDGYVALSLRDTATALTDGGATVGAEADGTLMRGAYAIRRNGSNLFIDANSSTGTITSARIGDVSLDGSEVLTNKTLTNPTINNYTEGVVAIGDSGTSKTIALTLGTFQTVTLTGSCTFTMPTATAGKSFILKVLSGAGGFTATFTGVKWPGNIAPVITATAGRYDLLSFIADGTAWSGSAIQNFTP